MSTTTEHDTCHGPLPLDQGQLAAAKASLWTSVLDDARRSAWSQENDDGEVECARCGAALAAEDAHEHGQQHTTLTLDDVDTASRVLVEACFESWATERAAPAGTSTPEELGPAWWQQVSDGDPDAGPTMWPVVEGDVVGIETW